MNKAILRIIACAKKEVGTRENIVNGHGNNRGRQVDEYQRADTLPGLGYAWCASFVAWVILTALGRDLCDLIWLRSASCDSILTWGRRVGIVSTQPTPGCAGLVMASEWDATHIFLVEDVLRRGVETIEGNTNTGGSREGIGVYERFRPFSSRYLYVNFAKRLPSRVALPERDLILPATKPIITSPFAGAPVRALYLDGQKVDEVPLLEGRTWLPVWKWAHWMNSPLGWNMEAQAATIAGREVAAQVKLVADDKGERRAWVPVRALATFSGLPITEDAKHNVLVA